MNNIVRILISFMIGLIGGITMVYIGVGTSLMIPLLMFTNVITDFKTAVGTIFLTVYSPILTIPMYNFYKNGNLDLLVAVSTGLGFFIGSYVTSTYYMNSVSKEMIYLWFGIYSLVVGYIFIKKSKYIF
jgi:uncharacterized membrane protein YfcA